MARIFISHSSANNDQAAQMKAWLASAGFESAFLDKDKTTGIPPGADWERTLYREVEQSQAVIIIQTPDWLASKWCFAEFTQARALGKAIFPAIEAPTGETLISPDIQALNLMSDREGGLERLKRELVRIALDAQGGFAWDSTRPPFPGLLAFQEEDAAVYFGRDDDIRRLIERLDARRAQGGAKLIALLGSSGSGKSSLLRAGVIPRLKRAGRNWIVVPAMRPRIHPVDELARALATASNPPLDWAKLQEDLSGADAARALDAFAGDLRVKAGASDAQILIPIDQAEELFGVADPDESRRFLEILSRALAENLPFIAVMTMRSDFLGQLQSATALTARFEEFSLGPMPLTRVPQIIEGPARIAGLGVEDAFVQQAAGDAETEDALPLLAFALRKLLNWPSNKPLTLERYMALGDEKAGLTPLENAVRQAAEDVLADAKPTKDESDALRDAFVPAMVRINDQGEYVRRPARLDELPAKAQPLLERLAKARLLIVRQEGDARVVEVAHEALLRKWPLLRSWLDSAREFLIGKQQLEQELRDWDQAAGPDKAGALLAGVRLHRARGWLIEHPNQLSAEEREFIRESIEHADEETRRRERTRRNITRGWIAATVVLALLLFGAGWAGWAAFNSAQQARVAQKLAVANESRALTALSQTASAQGHYTDAVKLALAAWPQSAADERPMLPRTVDMLAQGLSGPLEVSPPWQHYDSISSMAFSHDGARVVTVSGTSARVWDAATGVLIEKPLQLEDKVISAAFSPDGRRVVTVSGDAARMWDAATGALVGPPLRHEKPVWSAAFSPDGARVVTASGDMTARVWDAATGAPIGRALRHGNWVGSAAFSPDGKRVVTASGDQTARLWDAETGAPIGQPLQHDGPVASAAFSPDGKRVVTTYGIGRRGPSERNKVRLWDAATLAPIGEPLEHKNLVASVSFSPDGARMATASWDGTAQAWDTATGAQVGKPLQHEGRVNSAEFSADGARLVTGSLEGARVWDATTGAPISKPLRHEGAVLGAAFSPDGKRLVTVSDDKSARMWEAATGAPIGKSLQLEYIQSAFFTPDGKRVVAVNETKAQAWDAATGAPIGKPFQREDNIFSAFFGSDGAIVVTASGNAAQVWDVATGTPIGNPLRHDGLVRRAAFGSDGKRVVTTYGDSFTPSLAQVWDAATGAAVGKPIRHEGQVNSAVFSPNGAMVATASDDRTARVWDAATGAQIGGPIQHDDQVQSAAFSRDGAQILTVSGNTARVWDAVTRSSIGKPLQHEDKIKSAAFSLDGGRVVTASNDKTARVWDVATGALIGKPMRHRREVSGAAFSPNGALVATASFDNTTQVWDAATGAPIGQSLGHVDAVYSATFSPDGGQVLTVSGNIARLWAAPPVAPNIIATACKMLSSNHNTAGLAERYGIDVKDPICTGNEPAPAPLARN